MARPRLYGYARSSTNEQEDTLTAQIARIEAEYASRFKDTHEWGGVLLDRGVSGSVRLFNRPQGHNLSLAIEEGDVVVMTKLDRGFRNTLDFCHVAESCVKRGVRLILLDIGVDTGTVVGLLVGQILAAIAQFERSRIGERTREAVAVRRREGRPTAGAPPYGFSSVGERRKKKLVINERQREIGKQLLVWSDAGWTLEGIWYHLLTNKIYHTPPGQKYGTGREFSPNSIDRWIFEERRYQALEAQGVVITSVVAQSLPRYNRLKKK